MRLEARDKRTLLIGGVIAAVILVYVFLLAPFLEDLARKRDLMPKKEKDVAEMRALAAQYQEMRQRLQEAQAAAEKRGPLLTEIENLTRRANLSGKIVSLKPQAGKGKENMVEIRLDSITLYDVVNYVHLLEKATLRIKKLSFKPRFDNPKLLNATLLVASVG
ncbi:MAG TPA: type II secretion system protein GspM [Nitrospirota bacterium]|nr:type II secretion system protein GspM [Nitrospirota bacterium]